MKVIQSFGGPIIILEEKLVSLWGGISRNSFLGSSTPFATDYEGICNMTDGCENQAADIAKIRGICGHCLVIPQPLPTAIIFNDAESACIAQLDFSERSWDLRDTLHQWFDIALFDSAESFQVELGGQLTVFDSSMPGVESAEQCLQLNLARGRYSVASAYFQPDDRTALNLLRIVKIDTHLELAKSRKAGL